MSDLKLKVKSNGMIEDDKGVSYAVKFHPFEEGKKGDYDYQKVTLSLSFGSKREAQEYPVKSFVELSFEPTQTTLDDAQTRLDKDQDQDETP